MTSYKPPVNSPLPSKKATEAPLGSGDNALWRIPEWYPELAPATLEQLRLYHRELLKFNLKLNLISRQTERDADETHFADGILSVTALPEPPAATPIYDVGSGNGLPGLILGILAPEREVILIESDARKAEFLKHVIAVTAVRNVKVMNVRFETLAGANVKWALSRGFADIAKTCLMCNKILPVGSKFFHLKGNNWSTEIAELPTQLMSIWSPELISEYSLPVSQARRAIVLTAKKS